MDDNVRSSYNSQTTGCVENAVPLHIDVPRTSGRGSDLTLELFCRNNCSFPTNIFNVENVNLRGYKWNETISNKIRYVSNRIFNVNNEMCNTCATFYVTADNSRPMVYPTLKVIWKRKNKDWSIQKWSLFYSQNKTVQCLNNYQTCNNFPKFTDFQPPATAKP
jgi:hypothetical protein